MTEKHPTECRDCGAKVPFGNERCAPCAVKFVPPSSVEPGFAAPEVNWVPEDEQRAKLDRASRPERLRQVLNLYAQGAQLRGIIASGRPIARIDNGIQRRATREEAIEDLRKIEIEAVRLFDELVLEALPDSVLERITNQVLDLFMEAMKREGLGLEVELAELPPRSGGAAPSSPASEPEDVGPAEGERARLPSEMGRGD